MKTNNQTNQKKELVELWKINKETSEQVSDYSLDFLSDYSLENIHYLSDCFNEFADNYISVYYSDQFKYYEEHTTECEDALLELYDGESIANKIKKEGLYNLCCLAGVCGQYNEITCDLWEHEENIKKLLVIRYLIKRDVVALDKEILDELLEQAEDTNNDNLEGLLDKVQEVIINLFSEGE